MNHIAIKPIAHVIKRKVDYAAHKRLLKEFENTFDENTNQDKPEYISERGKTISRQIGVDIFVRNQIPIHLFTGINQLTFNLHEGMGVLSALLLNEFIKLKLL